MQMFELMILESVFVYEMDSRGIIDLIKAVLLFRRSAPRSLDFPTIWVLSI